MHYHWKTGQPCNCKFHKPHPDDVPYQEENIPRGDDSREIVGQWKVKSDED